jgi:hypothetical protein
MRLGIGRGLSDAEAGLKNAARAKKIRGTKRLEENHADEKTGDDERAGDCAEEESSGGEGGSAGGGAEWRGAAAEAAERDGVKLAQQFVDGGGYDGFGGGADVGGGCAGFVGSFFGVGFGGSNIPGAVVAVGGHGYEEVWALCFGGELVFDKEFAGKMKNPRAA